MGSASLWRAPPANSPAHISLRTKKILAGVTCRPNPGADPDTSDATYGNRIQRYIVGGDSQRDSTPARPNPRRATGSEPGRAHLQYGVRNIRRPFRRSNPTL